MSTPAVQLFAADMLKEKRVPVRDGSTLEKATESLRFLGFSAAPLLKGLMSSKKSHHGVVWDMAIWTHPAGVVVGALVHQGQLREVRAVVMSDEGWQKKKLVLPGSMYSTTEKRLDGARSFTHAFRAEGKHSIQSLLKSLVDNDYRLHGFEYWDAQIKAQQGQGWHFVFDHLRVKEALVHPKASEWLAALPVGVQSHLVNRPSQLTGGGRAWHLYVEELVSKEGQASLLDAPTPAHTEEVERWVRQALGEDDWAPAWHALPDTGLRLPHLMVAVLARSEGVSDRLQRWLKEAPQEAVEALVAPLPSGPTWVDLLMKHVLRAPPAPSFGQLEAEPSDPALSEAQAQKAWLSTTDLLHALVTRLPDRQRQTIEHQLLSDVVNMVLGFMAQGETMGPEVSHGLVKWVRHLKEEGLLNTAFDPARRSMGKAFLRDLKGSLPDSDWVEVRALFRESWLQESFSPVASVPKPARPRF